MQQPHPQSISSHSEVLAFIGGNQPPVAFYFRLWLGKFSAEEDR